jgi:hypothetical protein
MDLPYTNDLIRLATSALLARMECDEKLGVEAIRNGYMECLEAGGRPIALAEHHRTLRRMATARLHEPERLWEKLHALGKVTEDPPAGALNAVARLMPEKGLHWHVAHRVAGLGSLGREIRGDCGVARRIGCARGESAGAFGVRVGGTGQGNGADSLSGSFEFSDAAPRSVCAFRQAMDRAAAGAGLFPH